MQVLSNIDLRDWHTLAAQSQAKTLLLLQEPEELKASTSDDYILGGGSNTLFVGEIAQRIIHPCWRGISVFAETPSHVIVRAAAGERWNDVVCFCCENGWFGLENLAAIPGCIGAAPVQNIGAYGRQCADVLAAVEVYDRQRQEFLTVCGQDCALAYRDSRFKQDWAHYVIVAVRLLLKKQGELHLNYAPLPSMRATLNTPKDVYQAVTTIRWDKLPQPKKLPNAGSFFHNPIISAKQAHKLQRRYPDMPIFECHGQQVKIPAAWLIEHCGLKGVYEGAVGIYERHALILVNKGSATGAEILAFARRVQNEVYSAFDISLTIEPVIVGEER